LNEPAAVVGLRLNVNSARHYAVQQATQRIPDCARMLH
jgi:hypothetical protein